MVSLTGGDPVNSTVRPLQFMFRPGLSIVFMVLPVVVASAQTKTFVSPHDRIRALMVSVGPESRVEIRFF
jgi:hypothetical protein